MIICAIFFIASSLKNQDILTFIGSVIFLIACIVFLIPLVRSKKTGTVPLGLQDPKKLIQHVWDNNKKVDVLISNDTFPAIHNPLDKANVEDLNATIENVLVYPFKLMQEAIPKIKIQGRGNVIMVTSCRTELPLPGALFPTLQGPGRMLWLNR